MNNNSEYAIDSAIMLAHALKTPPIDLFQCKPSQKRHIKNGNVSLCNMVKFPTGAQTSALTSIVQAPENTCKNCFRLYIF